MRIRTIGNLASLALAVALLPTASAAVGDLPAAAKVLDDNTIMYMRPVPLVSPDGRLVAYVSRGFVCVADIEAGTTRRLAEVPDTWSHVFASAEETRAGGDPDSMSQLVGEKQKDLQARVTSEVGMFQWTIDSDAIVYGVSSYDVARKTTIVHVYRAPLAGEVELIADNDRVTTTRTGPGNMLTRDGRFLVGNSTRHERALIWNVAWNKPVATPFDYLAPSPSSGRWLGVEKDTRQLVGVDEDFKIVKRYDEFFPENELGFDMTWSPDERFVFWRQTLGFDHYSNWTGCRYDLQTDKAQVFTGDYMDEQITFTGFHGEFVRVGSMGIQQMISGLNLVEHYVALVTNDRVHFERLWSQHAPGPGAESKVRMLGRTPDVRWSPDFELFTIGLPRQEGPYGVVMHLMNRHRQTWKLPGDATQRFISPYDVVGFALDGKVIIANDDTRLFALPIEAIKMPENKLP